MQSKKLRKWQLRVCVLILDNIDGQEDVEVEPKQKASP